MTDEELQTKLYEKMLDEQIQYRNWLLGQPGITILANATQYAVREDIVVEMSALELPEVQARALLKSKTPLADIYREWQKTETHHMEDLRDVIENRADAVLRAEKEKGKREER